MTAITTMATTADGQIYNRYPRGYPGGNGYPSGGYGYPAAATPVAVVTVTRVQSMAAAPAVAAMRATVSATRTAATWPAGTCPQNKPFNPNPRNEYGNRTHGYNSSFGDKNYYRSEYSSGYAAGYQESYRGGREEAGASRVS